MKRAIIAALAALAFSFSAFAEGESYKNFYQIPDFEYPDLSMFGYSVDQNGNLKEFNFNLKPDKNGNYSADVSQGTQSAYSAFWTAISASIRACEALGQAYLAQEQTDRFAKNLSDLLYTTGVKITDSDGVVKTLRFEAGALGLALNSRNEQQDPMAGTLDKAFGDGTDGKSIERVSIGGDKVLAVKGFVNATESTDEFLSNRNFFVPTKKTEEGSIAWQKWLGWNPEVFQRNGVSGDRKGQLELANWSNPYCEVSLSTMLSSASHEEDRQNHRLLAMFSHSGQTPTLHYVSIGDIIQAGGGGVTPDGQSIEFVTEGNSTNIAVKGFAAAAQAAGEYSPRLPYTIGDALGWEDFGSMFGAAFEKPTDSMFGLTLSGLGEANANQVLAAVGDNGGIYWKSIAEATYTEDTGDRHKITFTEDGDGEAETHEVYLPRIKVETDEGGNSVLKWLDLNDESSTMHEFDLSAGGSKITDFYAAEGFDDWSKCLLTIVTSSGDSEDEGESIEAEIPVSSFDISDFTMEVTGQTADSANIQATITYLDKGGNEQTKVAPLTIPTTISPNVVPLVDDVTIATNSSNQITIKGFADGAACGETLKGLITSTEASTRQSHEILCRYGSGDGKTIHYLPLGDLLYTPDTGHFETDSSTGKFKIRTGDAGKFLKSTGDGIEWDDVANKEVKAEGVLETSDGDDSVTIRVKADAANNGKVIKTSDGSVGWNDAIEIAEGHPLELDSDGKLQFKVESQSSGKVLTIGTDNKPAWQTPVASSGGFAYDGGSIGTGAFAVGRKFYRVSGVTAGAGSWSLKVTIPATGTPSGTIVGVDAFSQTPTDTECWIPLYTIGQDGVTEDFRGAAMIPAFN